MTIRKSALGLAALAMSASLSLPAQGADVTLKLAHVAPPTSSFQIAAESFAGHLDRLSGSSMAVDIVPGGALGNVPQLWAQLRAGSLDLHLMDIGGVIAIKEARHFFIVFAPYLFRDQDHWRRFVASDTFAGMMAKAEDAIGFKYLGYVGDRSPRALSTKGKAVRTPDDIKGMKIRTPLIPAITKTFEVWGANPTPIKAAELYTALQTGLVDGQDNGIFDVVAAGYTEVQDYFTPLDYLHSGMGVWMSGAKWQSLTEQQQQWVRQAADAAYADARAVYDKELKEAFAAAKDKGLTIVEPDVAAFRAASRPVIEGMDGKAWPAGMYDDINGMK